MHCEIETKRSRPEGPFGRVDIRAHCKVHNFVVHGAEIGEICPIGQIEAARDEALAKIVACAGDPSAENDGLTTTPDPAPNTHTIAKRTRKPKVEPDA